MKPLGIILLLITISTCAFFSTNEALNEAQCLQRIIWSPRQTFEADQIFDSAAVIDKDTEQVATLLSAKAQRALRRADKIKSLPGQPIGVDFAQYAGYITVNKAEGRELFYYLAESPKNSSSKPLIVWFNGGPGCSSLGYGAMEEVGPFRVNADGKTLSRFKYAWNNVANTLFLESPAGVGFTKAKVGHANGDIQTAKENYIFLVNWLERFPQYKKRELFLAGESYAGHYIPQLADLILSKNALKNITIINLKGAAIGNAYVNRLQNRRDQDEFLWNRDFITEEAYEAVKKDCEIFYRTDNFTLACLSSRLKAFTGDLDNYNIYAPICLKAPDGSPTKSDETQGIDPCIDDFVLNYMNLPEVKKAFHADPNIKWGPCNDNLVYTLRSNNSVPTIKKIVTKGLRVMLYSGDIDSVVPITNTKKAVKAMQLTVKKPWRPWNCNDQVLGGFVEEYEGLSLVTVRGAGHMVPSNQPLRAFTVITYFLEGKPLPEEKTNNKMKTLHIILLLITISTCAFFCTNEALNEADCLQKVIWSPRESVESDDLFDPSIEIDKETEQVANPLSAKAQEALRSADKIKSLPGQPRGVDFEQYAGYITVNNAEGRELFYYLVETPKNSSSKPLILWLNGGPGCSSLGYGAMVEVGPFRVNADGKTLSIFKYAWNNVANILFVESPAGVGFSKAKVGQINGDARTAKENYMFLVNWLERFPQYKNHKLFLAGESYAGHYIPQFADYILSMNELKSKTIINLKGAAIGNPYVNKLQNRQDQDEYLWRRDFVTDEAHEAVKKDCEIFYQTENFTLECFYARKKAFIGYLDYYNIYAPLCLNYNASSHSKTDETEQGIDPCIDYFTEHYINLPEVKKAFHADPNIEWVQCNEDLEYTSKDNTSIPTIKKIVTKGLRVMLYSGDIDSVVPLTNTIKSVKALQLPVKKPWRPWNCDDQLGGFVEEYEGLTLVTVGGFTVQHKGLVLVVKGAGHMRESIGFDLLFPPREAAN
ncbi:hypothetical protein FCM35_KLT16922 [Carex littledalei]|uniref:Carboxypeptidase n=1 Tax=Carex littledalei TaxID=544730 RepID=A0A833RHZ9_9POAL|nr:hypothetical protein FCM35_KLT16922 [Carex littledalei]